VLYQATLKVCLLVESRLWWLNQPKALSYVQECTDHIISYLHSVCKLGIQCLL
jgi:hypothetical protein